MSAMVQTESGTLEVREVARDESAEWNDWVDRSPQGTIFHREEFLSIMEENGNATLHQLYVRNSVEDDVIGIFPFFDISRGPITTIFSPPPNLGIPHLGPALLTQPDISEHQAHSRNTEFLNLCYEWMATNIEPRFTHVRTSAHIRDPRPFTRDHPFRISPKFTFIVDLADTPDSIIQRFSRDARQNIRNTSPKDYEISVGGETVVEWIIEQIQRRYREQGEQCSLTKPFALELYNELPDGMVRPYICEIDEEYVTGMLVLNDDSTVYRWQGGTKTRCSLPVNDLLDWRIMLDAMDAEQYRYDMVGANIPRLSDYKSKFNPNLVPYYLIEGGSYGMTTMANLYKRYSTIRQSVHSITDLMI